MPQGSCIGLAREQNSWALCGGHRSRDKHLSAPGTWLSKGVSKCPPEPNPDSETSGEADTERHACRATPRYLVHQPPTRQQPQLITSITAQVQRLLVQSSFDRFGNLPHPRRYANGTCKHHDGLISPALIVRASPLAKINGLFTCCLCPAGRTILRAARQWTAPSQQRHPRKITHVPRPQPLCCILIASIHV